MNIRIPPAQIQGNILVPASKSMMQRACAAALLRGGKTIIHNYGQSNDDRAALNIIADLGADLLYLNKNELEIKSRFPNKRSAPTVIHCGESGLSMRMFTTIAAMLDQEIIITGSGSLKERPMDSFDQILPRIGISIQSNEGKIPLKIKGPLKPRNISIDGALSSQFLTGLLFAYSAADARNVAIHVENLNSKPYIDLTLSVMNDFGMNCPEHTNYETFYFSGKNNPSSDASLHYTIPGDWSNGAFLLIAGAIAGRIIVTGLDVFSGQADKKVLEALADCGAQLSIQAEQIEVNKAPLKAFHFNATDCPDLFPPLAALAAYCSGTSVIEGVQRLKHKESNRAETLKSEFEKLGIEIILQDDNMFIKGGTVRGGKVAAHGDHRIAMACAIAALGALDVVEISNPEAVEKSYPNFYEDLEMAGMRLLP